MTVQLQLRLPAGAEAATVARNCLQGLVRIVDPDHLENAQLLISELVTNSYRHGDGSAWIDVRVVAEKDCLRIDVVDEGPGFEAQNLPSPSPSSDEGWGLFLVDRLATRWGVSRSQETTQVWFELGQRRLANA